MNTKLLDQAIKTLESVRGALGSFAKADVDLTLGMLRQEKETAQPEQEPCRHRIVDIRNEAIKSGYMCMDCGALFGAYATPPQRKPFNHHEFGYWWFEHGSGLHPLEGEDQEQHAYRVASAAWMAAHGIKD